jgi:PAS domain S-box-containing protein
VADSFRTELTRRWIEPINVFEVSIQPSPFAPTSQEAPVVNYLRSTLAGQRLDLVVPIGGAAAVFARTYRKSLFPTTPILDTALEQRFINQNGLTNYETAVAVALDLGQIIDDLLRIRPQTKTMFAVIGSSEFETFWRGELTREFQRYAGRLTIIWLHDLSFPDILKRVAVAPQDSAIFYLVMALDAKGVLQSDEHALTQLHEVATAPILGIYDFQLGRGIVGGPLISADDVARNSVDVALRLLRGESAAEIRTPIQEHGPPTYDWRELQRWGISEARLPIGSIVRFRQPGLWDLYWSYIIGTIALVALQTGLISVLLLHRRRRRRAEHGLRESEQRFRNLANTLPVMVWTTRTDTTLDFVNHTIVTFTGVPVDDLLENGWLEYLHPDDVDPCQKTFLPAVAARRRFQLEYRLRRADGAYRWILDTGVPKYDSDGDFGGYIGSAIDISDRREMEQSIVDGQAALHQSLEQNQDLAGRLIHAQEAERTRIARDLHDDVSQQIAALAIMLGRLKRQAGPLETFDVELAVTSLQERTAMIASAIRDLSHELHPAVLQHAGLVATLQRHCADLEQQQPIAIIFEAVGNFDALGADVSLCLFRVAQEALTNASRHARATTVHVRLLATEDDAELRVADDGVGFASGSRRTSGLGLRSIDERVRFAGGRVAIESAPGHGTTVIVHVPVTVAVEPASERA